MSKHTPGPYCIVKADDLHIRCEADPFPLAVVPDYDDESKANAALFAAAPDLLDACKAMLTANTPDTIDAAYDALRAAIAKAEEVGT